MANQHYISAGLTPIDNSTGATTNTCYISAGLTPDDTAASEEEINRVIIIGMRWELSHKSKNH